MTLAGVLILAETRRGELRDVSLELIKAAESVVEDVGGSVSVAAIGPDANSIADALAAYPVDEVLTVDVPSTHFEAALWAAAAEALIDELNPSLVLCGHTVDSMGFAPRLAATKGLGFAADIVGLEWTDGLRVRRLTYGQKLVAELEFPERRCVLVTVRPGIFGMPPPATRRARIRELAVDSHEKPRTTHVSFVESPRGDVDITSADFLLSIGRGVTDPGEVPRFAELARRLGATLSSSRPLIDAGWLPSSLGVGQSSNTVKPRVYLALGISGAVQHLAGMRQAGTIIAVNSDPHAPIFGVAHYGAVADLFAVAEALEALA
jgi:electron transfer flavoprotein alpha subunit